MNPEQLSETIVDVLAALVADGAITLPDGVPTQVTVERPRQKGHGDYATNVALQLGKRAGGDLHWSEYANALGRSFYRGPGEPPGQSERLVELPEETRTGRTEPPAAAKPARDAGEGPQSLDLFSKSRRKG